MDWYTDCCRLIYLHLIFVPGELTNKNNPIRLDSSRRHWVGGGGGGLNIFWVYIELEKPSPLKEGSNIVLADMIVRLPSPKIVKSN